MQNLDTRNCIQRHWNVEVQVPGLGIIHAQAVQQNQRLLECSSTNREISLHAHRAARLNVDRGIETEEVSRAWNEQRLFSRLDCLDRTIRFRERNRRYSDRDRDGLGKSTGNSGSALLCVGRDVHNKNQPGKTASFGDHNSPTNPDPNSVPLPSSSCGSKRRFTARMASICSGVYCSASRPALRLPNPCSAETVPPSFTACAANSRSKRVASCASSALVGRMLRCRCASPRWP